MLHILNSLLWAITTSVIIILGIYLSIKLKFPQIKIKKIIKSLKTNNKKGITPLTTLFLTLAGRIGVGSIAGVALAIYIGGPGTIFWMWIISIISGSLAYSETLLSIKYKNKIKNIGGPPHYLTKALHKPKLGIAYSILVIIAYLIGFIPIQSNTITKSLNINKIILAILLTLLTFYLIKKGITRITKITNKLVPIMTIIYILMTLITIIIHIDKIPNIINQIITNAFNIKPFFTSFIPTILIGTQRAIFSNESGIGLGGIIASTSNETNGSKAGYIQILGIYITTFIICTSTAFLILISDSYLTINNPNGIELTKQAFIYNYPNIGSILLILSILMFSITTILTGYYYIEITLKYLLKKPKLIIIKYLVSLSVFMGCTTSPTKIWQIIDIIVAIMTLINLYAIYKLKKQIIEYHKECN